MKATPKQQEAMQRARKLLTATEGRILGGGPVWNEYKGRRTYVRLCLFLIDVKYRKF